MAGLYCIQTLSNFFLGGGQVYLSLKNVFFSLNLYKFKHHLLYSFRFITRPLAILSDFNQLEKKPLGSASSFFVRVTGIAKQNAIIG